jgi:hypothetical protein
MAYFPLSACQMDVLIAPGLQINAAMLASADSIAIITVIPLLDSLVYPRIKRWLGRPITVTEKYVCGILVALAAILVAAFLEVDERICLRR